MFCALFFAQGLLVSAYPTGELFIDAYNQDSTKLHKEKAKKHKNVDKLINQQDLSSNKDSLIASDKPDTSLIKQVPDSSNVSTTDTTKKAKKPFLDDIVVGKGRDSMIYDVKSGKLWIYKEGDITYTDKQMTADYFEMQLDSSKIIAKG
ncbi:MAG: hypothetical protein RR388_01305, partial [Rikenellaceae bacterium]